MYKLIYKWNGLTQATKVNIVCGIGGFITAWIAWLLVKRFPTFNPFNPYIMIPFLLMVTFATPKYWWRRMLFFVLYTIIISLPIIVMAFLKANPIYVWVYISVVCLFLPWVIDYVNYKTNYFFFPDFRLSIKMVKK